MITMDMTSLKNLEFKVTYLRLQLLYRAFVKEVENKNALNIFRTNKQTTI